MTMKVKKTEITDFYRELSLLLNSNLPLPESLRQLAENFQRRDVKEFISKLAADTESGVPLSDAMKSFPDCFQPFHIKMIEGGEKSGTLPDILSEAAYISHIDSQLISMVRTIAAYPIFVVMFSAGLMFFLFSFIIPHFDKVFEELLEGQSLPPLTELVISVSRFCLGNFPIVLAILIALSVFLIWLFVSASSSASRCFIRIIKALPLSNSIFNNLMMARICSMWSVFIRQKMSAHEAFETISGLMDDRMVSSALRNISRNCHEGKPIAECLKNEGVISDLIAVAIKHAPEGELHSELATLADIYKDRASTAIRNTGMTWELILIIAVSMQVGFVVISLFMPLIVIIEKLGGC